MTAIKICGLRDEATVQAVVTAGVEFIGFMFAESKRRVTPDHAANLRKLIPANGPKVVGVFVNEDVDTVNAIADTVGLDYVQLCGEESAVGWTRKVIRSVQPADMLDWGAYQPFLDGGALLLVDAAGSRGGSGHLSNWTLAHEAAQRTRVMLAGGLGPDNVADAIVKVSPWGVDVSSGVETGGVKDISKIQAFVTAVRSVVTLSVQS